MIDNDSYEKISTLVINEVEPVIVNRFFSVSRENLSLYETTGEEALTLLESHRVASGLFYFSEENISLILDALSKNKNEKIKVIVGGVDAVTVTSYLIADFSILYGFLSFENYKKTEDEIDEESLILGLSVKSKK